MPRTLKAICPLAVVSKSTSSLTELNGYQIYRNISKAILKTTITLSRIQQHLLHRRANHSDSSRTKTWYPSSDDLVSAMMAHCSSLQLACIDKLVMIMAQTWRQTTHRVMTMVRPIATLKTPYMFTRATGSHSM